MPENGDAGEPKDVSVEEALDVIRNKIAPPQKTYEEGLQEGRAMERKRLAGEIEKVRDWASRQAEGFAEAHGNTSAGTAFQQMAKDVQNRISRLMQTPDGDE